MKAKPVPEKNLNHNESITRPNRGLTLDSLSLKKLHKNYQSNYITNTNSLCKKHPADLLISKHTFREQQSKEIAESQVNKNKNQNSRNNNNSHSNKNFSSSSCHFYSSRIPNVIQSSKRYPTILSPTSRLFRSKHCHKYHTDLDYNYLADQKFLKDAFRCGKDRLTTTALKSSSPEKYFYQNKVTPKNRNRYSKSYDLRSNVEVENYLSQEEQKIFIERAENENQDNVMNTKLTINNSNAGENPYDRYLEGLEQILTLLDSIFEKLSIDEKVEKLLELVDDQRRSVRLGALVGVYIILKKYQIATNHKELILEKMLVLLKTYEIQEEYFLVACLEICSLYGPCDALIENISLICIFITDFNYPKLQKATFNCLMSLEYEGIRTLVELASKDNQEYQQYVLTSLISTPHIQRIVLIRALLNDIFSTDSSRRHTALAAINRMQDLVSDQEAIEKLSPLFNDSKLEKIFLASTLRTSGFEGENILLDELKNNKDFSVRVAIASVLSYRIPKYPSYLEIRLDKNDAYSITKTLPGNFCRYYGKISPYVYENSDIGSITCDEVIKGDESNEKSPASQKGILNTQCEEYLEVSSRDFLAALQRMLIMPYDHSNPQIALNGNPNLLDDLNLKTRSGEIVTKHSQFFETKNKNSSKNEGNTNISDENNLVSDVDDNGRYYISDDVITSLCRCLTDYSTAVRDTAASSLGQIGLPEALISVEYLLKAFHDEDVNVQSKAIWAVGRMASGIDGNAVIEKIIDALQSNMWKVKCACLFTLSQFGPKCAKAALPLLTKLLKESCINKQTIAETIIRLGNEGESVLLKLMSQENDCNYKLKSSVLKSFGISNVNSSNIDFIVECLFRHANCNSSILRKCALFSIRVLAENAEEKVTYLKIKNIIPFYYEKMMDKDLLIQSYAVNCIKSLGPQGELIFIDGLVKDISPIIRMNCAIGLSELGPHTIRALLIGLHDENESVRKTVERAIIEKLYKEDIVKYFSEESRAKQLMSLKIAIKDILEKEPELITLTKDFFMELLVTLDQIKVDEKLDFEKSNNKQQSR